jgi:hypothetical protein
MTENWNSSDDRVLATIEQSGDIQQWNCGSRVTCVPPPTDTDRDVLVLCGGDGALSWLHSYLTEEGFKWEGDREHYQNVATQDDTFLSFRRGELNLIVTRSPIFATRHRAATQLCKQINVLDKDERIKIFQQVLYGR